MAAEVLKVVDVPFDTKRLPPEVLLVVHEGDDLENSLQGLRPQEDGTARVFDIFRTGNNDKEWTRRSNFINRHFYDRYPDFDIRRRGALHLWFQDPVPSLDIQNVSFQWNQDGPHQSEAYGLSAYTHLRISDRQVSAQKSFLLCLNQSSDKLLVINIREWPPIAAYFEPRANLLKTGRQVIDCLSCGHGFTAMGDGRREHFVRLLVLDFLASNVYLFPGRTLESFRWPETGIVQELHHNTFEPEAESLAGFYIDSLERHERVLENLHSLAEGIDFVVETLLKDPQQTTKNLDRERLFTLQQLCRQRLNHAQRSMDRLNRSFEARDKLHNIEESISVKRLTILATIFLPLSLSTSILSMGNRFVDLNLKLYDFIGVFFIVGTLAILILIIVRAIGRLESNRFAELIFPSKTWAAAKLEGNTVTRKLLAILLWILYLLIWAVVLVSFIVGMVKSVILGLKILGFGAAGVLVYMVIGVVLVFVVEQNRDRWISKETHRNGTNSTGERS